MSFYESIFGRGVSSCMLQSLAKRAFTAGQLGLPRPTAALPEIQQLYDVFYEKGSSSVAEHFSSTVTWEPSVEYR